jgi:hypothetical protein
LQYTLSGNVSDYDRLMSMIVSDRIKSTLSENCLRHIITIETTQTDGWLMADKLAEAVDLYLPNQVLNEQSQFKANSQQISGFSNTYMPDELD